MRRGIHLGSTKISPLLVKLGGSHYLDLQPDTSVAKITIVRHASDEGSSSPRKFCYNKRVSLFGATRLFSLSVLFSYAIFILTLHILIDSQTLLLRTSPFPSVFQLIRLKIICAIQLKTNVSISELAETEA